MHLIFCVDEGNGLSFCGRRLSQDRTLIQHMLRLTAGSCLWVHPYSEKLFPEGSVHVDQDYIGHAKADDYCFVEKGPFPATWDDIHSVTLYHWNRAYPSTERFPRSLLENMHLEFTEEFPGNSHENITMERFVL